MLNCYCGHSIFKAGPKVLKNITITDNVQSYYYNITLSEKDLLHHDVYAAILRKDLDIYVSNFQFVIPFKSHHTPLSAKKLLALCDTNSTQGLLMCPTKNVAEWVKTNDRYTSHINSPLFQYDCRS